MCRTAVVFATLSAALAAVPAAARAGEPIMVRGAELVETIDPPKGFVDDPFGFNGAGGRLLYVNSDAGRLAAIHVFDPAQKAGLATVDISRFTSAPAAVDFALDGEHFFVVSREREDGPATAALFDASGKVVRKFGPADEVSHVRYRGHEAVSLYRSERVRRHRGGALTRHTVEVFDLASGRRLGKKAVFETDLKGYSKKLDFELKYWADGYTRAVGIKGGRWDPKSDKRSPDYQAVYELPSHTFSERHDIKNVITHTKRMRLLAKHSNEEAFLKVADDLSGVLWIQGQKQRRVKLAESFRKYDHTSLRYRLASDGTLFFTLQVDPVNPDAVARKRADRPWLDLYVLEPGKARAERKARLLPPKRRSVSWQASERYWAVVPRHIGFDRGGDRLFLFRLK